MAGDLRELCKEELHGSYSFLRCYLGDKINEDEMGGACALQGFGGGNPRERDYWEELGRDGRMIV